MGLSYKSHMETKHWLGSFSHCLDHLHPASDPQYGQDRAWRKGPESCQRPWLWIKRSTGVGCWELPRLWNEAGRTYSSHVPFHTYSKVQRKMRPLGATCGPVVNTSFSLRVFLRSTPQKPPHLSNHAYCSGCQIYLPFLA